MRKIYELWLDESGDFTDEAKLKGTRQYASLIGGILIEKELADQADLDAILDSSRTHAMELTDEDKRSYVLPVLEKIKELGGRMVYFENTEYEDDRSNRQLYLRMMAEGLIQLLQTLNAEEESVQLKATIAQRQDMQADYENRRIAEEEYLTALRRCIGEKRRNRQIFLHEDSEIQFMIRPAHREQKLQIADFACNTRLSRNSRAFEECKERVRALFTDAYLLKLHEVGSLNYVKRCLVQYDFAGALMEIYLSRDQEKALHEEMLRLLKKRMKNTSYRLVKAQIQKYAADISAYASTQEDYEVGEKILLKINEELIPLLKKEGQSYQHLQISILLQLTDVYLREGDIDVAADVLAKCEESHKSLGQQLEDLPLWYEIQEKKALLAIRSFDYRGAVDILENLCSSYEEIMKYLNAGGFVNERFTDLRSSALGNVLSLRIYAMLFLQRENPQLYEELCSLSDWGMAQYQKREEQEKHRIYRSQIEMEAGNYEEALRWLLSTKSEWSETIDAAAVEDYLKIICRKEDELGRQSHLLAYMMLMSEAKMQKHPVADQMFGALETQERLLKEFRLKASEEARGFCEIPTARVSEETTGILYHPLELVHWKYATYLWKSEKHWKAAVFYEKAIDICFKYPDYDAMQIIGIGITAEYICCLHEIDKQSARKQYTSLLKKVGQLEKEPLPAKTMGYFKRMSDLIKKADLKKGKIDCECLRKVSEKLVF